MKNNPTSALPPTGENERKRKTPPRLLTSRQSNWLPPPGAKPEMNPKLSRRLHRKQAADYLGVSLSWLDKARLTGIGPVFISIGGRIVYDLADLDDFLLNFFDRLRNGVDTNSLWTG